MCRLHFKGCSKSGHDCGKVKRRGSAGKALLILYCNRDTGQILQRSTETGGFIDPDEAARGLQAHVANVHQLTFSAPIRPAMAWERSW